MKYKFYEKQLTILERLVEAETLEKALSKLVAGDFEDGKTTTIETIEIDFLTIKNS